MDLKDIKLEYIREELNISDLNSCPIKQLQLWFKEVKDLEISYPNAASLATVDTNGVPSNRIILIKEVSDQGLIFFTDYDGNKAKNLLSNNNASILLYWKELDRQIRITGKTKKIPLEDSKEYFYSRPKESQISALASKQSSIITKEELYKKVDLLNSKYQNSEVDFPENWGGFIVSYEELEFWQGRPNRLHDRFLYTKEKSNWIISRLSP